jgi:VIT1/CCC1 family predicted Fe2+/Mn2+ transporter
MNSTQIDKKLRATQKAEITEHVIYHKLSRATTNAHNKDVLLRISHDEMRHYRLWKDYTKRAERPKWIMVWVFYLISRIFGLSFGLKLMEHGEGKAQATYRAISDSIPQALDIAREEDEHEQQLIQMIDEERLDYVGSMIRGLNDALVELTGALAGLTLALENSRLVAMAGLITGIAASLSMGSTEYLASKSEESKKAPAEIRPVYRHSLYSHGTVPCTTILAVNKRIHGTSYYDTRCDHSNHSIQFLYLSG